MELVSGFSLLASSKVGVNLSLKLTNPEVCIAYFTKSYSFDLSDIYGNTISTAFSRQGWDGLLQIDN